MIRISTLFVALCMLLIAASVGLTVHALARFSLMESAIVAVAVMTFFVLGNVVTARARDRGDHGAQIADLSRGTADLARQVAEFGRRLASLESRLNAAPPVAESRVDGMSAEIGELGLLVRQLATTVATHEDVLAARPSAPAPLVPSAAGATNPSPRAAPLPPPVATPAEVRPVAATPAAVPPPSDPPLLSTIRAAVEAGRMEIFLQPIVTLPQRKVRFYEAVTRLRDAGDAVIAAEVFVAPAEQAGLIGAIDHALLLRCMQVLRRLSVRNKDVGIFCNLAGATLANVETFTQCLDFLEANRALAASFVIELKQSTMRALTPLQSEHLAALAQRGYRFSIDHVTDLRFDPRDLADRGVRFIKVPAALLLESRDAARANIDPADLSDLLGRHGIDLIAERIEGERAVVDLLDFDVRFGQGFLFASPRPLRPDNAEQGAPDARVEAGDKPPAAAGPRDQPAPRAQGNAALVRRAAGPA